MLVTLHACMALQRTMCAYVAACLNGCTFSYMHACRVLVRVWGSHTPRPNALLPVFSLLVVAGGGCRCPTAIAMHAALLRQRRNPFAAPSLLHNLDMLWPFAVSFGPAPKKQVWSRLRRFRKQVWRLCQRLPVGCFTSEAASRWKGPCRVGVQSV